jgi:hypothetical protein
MTVQTTRVRHASAKRCSVDQLQVAQSQHLLVRTSVFNRHESIAPQHNIQQQSATENNGDLANVAKKSLIEWTLRENQG